VRAAAELTDALLTQAIKNDRLSFLAKGGCRRAVRGRLLPRQPRFSKP
jgi:hypothetical protein